MHPQMEFYCHRLYNLEFRNSELANSVTFNPQPQFFTLKKLHGGAVWEANVVNSPATMSPLQFSKGILDFHPLQVLF